jgi:LytS/YehU family sensor histidine kinase
LLVENVIKHNTADDEFPIRIKIVIAENKIAVENRISKKENTKSGFGLNNLATRYRLFNKEQVSFFEKDGQFHVHVPLIKNVT